MSASNFAQRWYATTLSPEENIMELQFRQSKSNTLVISLVIEGAWASRVFESFNRASQCKGAVRRPFSP